MRKAHTRARVIPDPGSRLRGLPQRSGPLAPEAITVGAATFIPSRLLLLGSPFSSRKDARDALTFAAAHDVLPRIITRPFEETSNLLDEMNEHRLRDHVVLTSS